MERVCLDCGTPVTGRVDKKFCSDQCRNSYNNSRNSDSSSFMRNVNSQLRKNRRILMELNPEEKTTVNRDKLAEKGFNFNYFTNTYTTRSGKTYYFCYEQGYLPLDGEKFALVLRKEYVS